jgi:hypothetical protein
MPSARPRYAVDAWGGGFVLDRPEYVASVAAVDGTVVAATERIYLLCPGATKFQVRDMPDGAGDAMCVAVEPRRPGSRSRFAVAGIDSLHIFEGERIASVRFPEGHGEIEQLLWAPDVTHGKATPVLYLRLDDRVMLLARDGGPFGTFGELEGAIADARTMASDHAGGFAYACFDEERWELDVWFLAALKPQEWYRRSVEAPSFFSGARLAIAGKSVAVSFNDGGVWLTRDIEHHPFKEIEELKDGGPEHEVRGPAIAFEGGAGDAALVATVRASQTTLRIVRIDAGDRATRIAEVETHAGEMLSVCGLAWDATRRTLWSAAGQAGIMCTTAPGVQWPLGTSAVS